MQHNEQLTIRHYQFRRGFTLVEMLIVLMVISLLAALTMFAAQSAVSASQETKTRSTILKLDTALRRIYEEYGDRFGNILASSNYNGTAFEVVAGDTPEQINEKRKNKALLKLHLIYDLMRLELPDHKEEVDGKVSEVDIGTQTKLKLKALPAVCAYYNNNADNPELLFQIIQNLSPEILAEFKGSEIGDTDNDGLYEFLDAWGHPIRFIRFAPALPQSRLQPDIWKLANGQPNQSNWSGIDAAVLSTARLQYPNPLDPDNLADKGWFLYPVIYSAGPDGKYDLYLSNAVPNGNQSLAPFNVPNGVPVDGGNDGGLDHHDNISNHHTEEY